MTYHGHVRNGIVIFDPGITLPEGAAVEVRVVTPTEGGQPPAKLPTHYERLQPVIGAASGCRRTWHNHDHYLHGQPREPRQRVFDTFCHRRPSSADAAHGRCNWFRSNCAKVDHDVGAPEVADAPLRRQPVGVYHAAQSVDDR
jgi:hypothetical protein